MAIKQLKAMISSTSLDLPEHRSQVLDACLRQSVTPLMMEHLPALDAEAIEASLDLVDEADIYIGIFAHRYGYIPKENNPEQISITEMEYNRAVERPIPRFLFFIHDDHPIKKASEIEKGIGGEKLDALKERIGVARVGSFFKSPEDLRGHVISTLVAYQKKIAKADAEDSSETVKTAASDFHYVSKIPKPPEVYVAHPYTLMQTGNLVGRQAELNTLTDWVSRTDSDTYKTHILNVVAIGGMGKSALTWKWFNDIAPEEMEPLAGRMWWSFYESDASFENFIIRALAYVSLRSIEEIKQLPSPDREAELLAALDRVPFLLVLDGLERTLLAYARGDAARLRDSEVGDQKNVRKATDPRVGNFLKKLGQVKNSRILISTRLFPAELETEGGDSLPNVFRLDLKGLTEDDAIQLWRAFGISGSRDLLQPIFDSIDKHPLLIQALAGEVKRYKRAPGNFEEWRRNNPRFDPTSYPRVQDAMGHVMEFSLEKLNEKPQKVLQIIAAFRMPVGYATLTALMIGDGKAFADELEIDGALVELEDRGLVGWDKRANRYDLHPIVRGVVWSELGADARQGVYTSLHAHFESMPKIENWNKVETFEDITPAIELYNTLIGMERYDDAVRLFRERLSEVTLYRLSANRQRVELLKMLFPDGLDRMPRLKDQAWQGYSLGELALGYKLSGQPGHSVLLYRRGIEMRSEMEDPKDSIAGMENLSDALRWTGKLYDSEELARRALVVIRTKDSELREGDCLCYLGLALMVRGVELESRTALERSLIVALKKLSYPPYEFLALRSLWFGDFEESSNRLEKAIINCESWRYEQGIIRSAGIQGEVALALSDLAAAGAILQQVLTRARTVNFVEAELPALVALTELNRRQGDTKTAREFLDDVWEYAERGPYPLLHADALNVLAQIERDAGNTKEAIKAATKAYQLSWCDGPPYAYHWGLEKAKQHLKELKVEPPEMKPFNEADHGPMPEVEINPDDEFHVGESE